MRLIDADVLLDDMKNELEKAIKEDLQEDECKAILTSAIALKSFVDRQPIVEAIPKEKLQEIVERLEDMYQPCYLCREDRCAIDRAIEIVKEVGGMNDSV